MRTKKFQETYPSFAAYLFHFADKFLRVFFSQKKCQTDNTDIEDVF